MSYQATLDYLFSRLPMFSRIGAAAYKPDLNNTIELAKYLGNPEQKIKTIHVAGTNGKGSVSHMLAAVFQQAGYKTGLYTSPHLHDFRERIKINGEMVTEKFVEDFTDRTKLLIETINPSFFEITVMMAFTYFAEQGTDIAIIETGLGGRLDSTNIITPELSVITNIGWDHMSLLGDTLEKIAGEKAGIIKDNIPVVVGETLHETMPVFEKTAQAKMAPLHLAYRERQAMDWHWEKNRLIVEVADKHETDHQVFSLDLPGLYQVKNLLTVLASCDIMSKKGWKLTTEGIHEALGEVKKLTGLHGRWEMIHESPKVILDVAHNRDGIEQVLEQVELSTWNHLHFVIGMVRDKEVEQILALLPKDARYYFTKAQIPRALDENSLKQAARLQGLKGEAFPDVNQALQAAIASARKDDLVIVCGSVFIVGEVTR